MDVTLIEYLQEYPSLIALIGSFIAGSAFILVLSVSAAHYHVTIETIIIFAILGNFLSDYLWFLLGRWVHKSKWSNFLTEHPKLKNNIHQFNQRHSKKDALYFITIKFIYGIRILTIISLGVARYPAKKFLAFNFIAVIVINFCICLSGYLYGKGMTIYLERFNQTLTAITSIALALIFFIAIKKAINKVLRN